MFGRKQQKAYSSAWNEQDHRNDAAKATLKAMAHRFKGWRVFFVVSSLLGLLAFLVSLSSASLAQKNDSRINDATSTSQTEKPGMQVALQSVRKWLSTQEASPYPGGISGLQWTGATKVASHIDNAEQAVKTDYWSHRFTFTDNSSGATKQVAQLVSVSNGEQVSIGVPSILPPVPTSSSGGVSTAPAGYPTIRQSDSLTTLVTQWAKAYAGDDDDALTVLVGDHDPDHLYKAAHLGTFHTATVSWAVWAGDGHGSEPEQGKGYGAVSVLISFTPVGASSTSTVNTSLTLLVDNPAGGAPKVVAWGADGDIKGLRPHGNAVDKSTAKHSNKDNTDLSSPAPENTQPSKHKDES